MISTKFGTAENRGRPTGGTGDVTAEANSRRQVAGVSKRRSHGWSSGAGELFDFINAIDDDFGAANNNTNYVEKNVFINSRPGF